MPRHNLNDRFTPGGSMEPRLNPEICDTRLNANLGPKLPRPLVRETNSGAVYAGDTAARRRAIGLPSRFTKD
jgi:hypothetical protein